MKKQKMKTKKMKNKENEKQMKNKENEKMKTTKMKNKMKNKENEIFVFFNLLLITDRSDTKR